MKRLKISTDTIVRTVVLALALINQCLVVAGVSPLPIDDAQLTETVSTLITMIASVWAWYKNNSISQAAIAGDKVKDAIKAGSLDTEAVDKLVE